MEGERRHKGQTAATYVNVMYFASALYIIPESCVQISAQGSLESSNHTSTLLHCGQFC